MGLSWFCNHEKYEVLSWKYINLGRYDQSIEAKVKCKNCNKVVIKKIEGDRCAAFAIAYEEFYGK